MDYRNGDRDRRVHSGLSLPGDDGQTGDHHRLRDRDGVALVRRGGAIDLHGPVGVQVRPRYVRDRPRRRARRLLRRRVDRANVMNRVVALAGAWLLVTLGSAPVAAQLAPAVGVGWMAVSIGALVR